MDFSARYILVRADEEEELDEAKTKDLFDTVIVHDGDVDRTATLVGDFVYREAGEDQDEEEEEANGDANGDANMADAPSGEEA